MTKKWYEQTSAQTPLTQGDVIVDCPVLSWKNEPFELSSEENHEETLRGSVAAVRADVVVMSQACDLQQNKISNVILCPCLPISVFKAEWEKTMQEQKQNPTDKAWKSLCRDIKDGYQWNLAPFSGGIALPSQPAPEPTGPHACTASSLPSSDAGPEPSPPPGFPRIPKVCEQAYPLRPFEELCRCTGGAM